MVYLIESPGYKEDDKGNTNYFKLLKIGYTKDSSKEKRFFSYKHHNPCSKVLYEIPGATEDQERRIQYKFKNLQFSEYGREWFRYSEDIINFFKSIETLEEIDQIPRNTDDKRHLKYKNRVKEAVKYLTSGVTKKKEFYDLCKDIFNYLGEKVVDWGYTLKYLRTRFGDSKVNRYLEIIKSRETGIYCEDPEINKEVCRFLEKYNSFTRAVDKMKYLCKSALSGTISPSTVEIILGQIPDNDEIKSYYVILGPQKLRSLSYDFDRIKKSIGIVIFSPEILNSVIYSEFKVGEKYTLSNLKNKLKSIYSSINYNSSPKATDISRWFEIRNCQTTEEVDGKKKRVNGYELLRSLETELSYAQ